MMKAQICLLPLLALLIGGRSRTFRRSVSITRNNQ
jgi:hypothetical protein